MILPHAGRIDRELTDMSVFASKCKPCEPATDILYRRRMPRKEIMDK